MKDIIPIERIENRIFLIRGHKVMIDRDLAELYGVTTKRLNEQVHRNLKRFPDDFMFSLTQSEKDELVANCDQLDLLKHSSQLPYAFTEQGIAMLSSVLRSDRAIEMNILIMRTFVKLRQVLATHQELAAKFRELESRVGQHDSAIREIFEAIKQMIAYEERPRKAIGFRNSPSD